MKKVTYEYGCRALGYMKGEFFVDENMTDSEIQQEIEDMAEFGVYFYTDDGYEECAGTVYRKTK